jgi:7-cyano-7-deazaguanine reductase
MIAGTSKSISFGASVENMSDASVLETFENPCPDRDYEIFIEQPEFTSLCPKTGHPDFATIQIRYVPGPKCVELKSLKIYLQSYRNEGVFYERLVNRILDDLCQACQPKRMEIVGQFTPRGGIRTHVTARYPA